MQRIFLPLCTPGFFSAGIFAFILAQNEFLYALIFLIKSAVRTGAVGIPIWSWTKTEPCRDRRS